MCAPLACSSSSLKLESMSFCSAEILPVLDRIYFQRIRRSHRLKIKHREKRKVHIMKKYT